MAIVFAGCSTDRDGFGGSSGAFADAGGPPPPEGGAPACNAVSLEAGHRPLDLFITLDRSGSMEGVPWKMAKVALEEFFANPGAGDVSVALNYFPAEGSTDCRSDVYRFFSVPLGSLPENASLLAASLERTSPIGGTPTGVALDGALFTATRHKRAHPDRQVAVVVVSDGVPSDCTDPALLTRLPRIGLAEYGTLTFAIGIGGEPGPLMDTLAQAGGTDKALSVSDASQIGVKLREAQVQAVACELLFPKKAPNGRPTSPDLVNVVIRDERGARQIGRVARVSECENREGWYFDDPERPEVVRLCPASCRLVKSRKDAKADVQFGCRSEGPR